MFNIFGDCFEEIKNIETNSIDLILTDPPYEIDMKDGHAKNPLKRITNDTAGSIDWDTFFKETYRVLKPNKMMFICCRTDMIIRISAFLQNSEFIYAHDLVWLKGDMGYGNLNIMGTTHELLLAISKGKPEKSRVIIVDDEEKKRTPAIFYGKITKKEYYKHPTQKPVGLLAYIIMNRTDEGDVVLDPFAGVGSTLVAAKILNRNYIGIEIDKEFFDLSEERLHNKNHLKQYIEMLEFGLIRFNGAIKFRKD